MSKLNAETKAVLRDLDAVAPLVKGDPDIAVVRRAYDDVFARWNAPPSGRTCERWVNCRQLGDGNRALVIEPADGDPGATTLVLIHGGGWSLGTALCYAPLGRWLCAELGVRVLVPDFPQAPEHTAPAQTNALAGLLVWASSEFGNAFALIGDSAGGNLAAVLSNTPPEGVLIRAQALLYPVVDLRPDARYPSRRRFGKGRHFLTVEAIVGAAMQYAGETSPGSPLLTPMLANDFSATPPTVILVPECDPLFDEGVAYGTLLKRHGVHTEVVIAKGTIHGCVSFSGRIPSAEASLIKVCEFLTNQRLRS
ncbi:MAG: alpha/beta hydrolase [Hyphomonas sp.]|uniref:alpha/beta hydrolase n=1 Tax=Hyphomonas sp. TaxID=87 RepID=UPI001858CBB8|nr:alpha/beta hydrolase [Hyphomonas sp.]MBA3069060.1 alpha/beta hydrolase [Hyphomonas sp.]MBU3918966.1 alpha/beta hydrolase [Alphaproteobacteria bacterium]MBU4061694.1 alpha/beta hydrolase [Alphaproteobacteria bacterium]MBU4163539.1 alpha/beta hydrolase [Alphaproteobacteria bacterium]